MFNFNGYVHLRYVLLIITISALVPSTSVKGRANDPLLQSTWWKVHQHSAVLMVALATIWDPKAESYGVSALFERPLTQWRAAPDPDRIRSAIEMAR